MKVQELTELALLDVHGLLDDEERQSFERAFASAPASVQAQIRREQVRFSDLSALLPQVDAPSDLRARVLARVRAAITEQESVHRNGGGRTVPPIIGSRRVSPIWRAGALGFAAAAVVFAVTTIQMRVRYDELESTIGNDILLSRMLETLGPNHIRDMLFDGQTERVRFTSTDPEVSGEASLWLNPDWESARLFYLNLPRQSGDAYKLAVIDESGNVVDVLAEFDSSGGLMTRDVKASAAAGNLAILGPGAKGDLTPLMVTAKGKA